MAKVCPFMVLRYVNREPADPKNKCVEHRCAWWCEVRKCCGVMSGERNVYVAQGGDSQ